jgi:hypothetical protein
MNNPIEINAFKHYLEINSVRTQILEPIGFDGSNFVCEQDKEGYGRDVYYGNTDIELEFHYEYGINELPSGLELLLDQENLNGSESDVNYILTKNGIDFNIGQLDFAGATTDNESYFKCKVIQNNQQAKIKKRSKVKVDAFATKDLDDNTITPIETVSLLLKAKPVDKISSYSVDAERTYDGSLPGANADILYPFIQINKYGIEDTLTPAFNYFNNIAAEQELKIVRAVNTLTNVKIKGRLKYRLNSAGQNLIFVVKSGIEGTTSLSNFEGVTLPNNYNTIIDHSFEINLPNTIETSIIIWAYLYETNTPAINMTIYDGELSIYATETGIDSVIKGVRYIDLIKQNYKAIGSLPVNAPKFDVGGQFYNQICFSGKLIRQIINEPFYLELDKTIESLLEVNATPQINDNEIYIGQYQDFYSDVNMGTYLQLPETEAKFTKNEKYLINTFKFGYNKFEQDRDEDNTLDSIHTDSEWYLPCDNSINSKELKLPFVRDAYKIESVRRRATEKDNTSNESDDDIFIVDVIEVAPGTTRSMSGTFTTFLSDENNTYKILANQTFRWDLLGFKVGDTVIVSGFPLLVIDITSSILTLDWFGASFSGNSFFTITYPITDVLYTTRTNEGLLFSQNLLNADKYANLRYSIKRNMFHWFPYLATAGKFIPTKTIKNSYFKSNGEAITKFIGETANTTEKEDIAISNITSKKILSQNMYMTTLVIEFEDLATLIGKIQTQRGYINVQDHKGNIVSGYIVSLDHTWATNECVINLEVKN